MTKKRKISIGTYNGLYASAEEGLQNSWEDLGVDDTIERADLNKKFNKHSTLPNIYYVYKKNANYIVDEILKQLDIEVKDE